MLSSSHVHLAQNRSGKKIQRRPSYRYLKTPKSKYQIENIYQQNKNEKKEEFYTKRLHSRQGEKKDSRQNITNTINNICYISPKHSQSSKRFRRMPKSPLTNDKIQGDSFYQLNFNAKSDYMQNSSSKKSLYRTSKQFDNQKLNQAYYMSSNSLLCSKQQQFNVLRLENKNLKDENTNLSSRIKSLKQQNQYLYTQLQTLNNLLAQQRQTNQKLTQSIAKLQIKNIQMQNEVKEYKANYKMNQNLNKSYEILQHIHLKIKNQLQQSNRKNKTLMIQNERLSNQVSSLSKLLQQIPIDSRRDKKANKSRHLSEFIDKENYTQNSPLSPVSLNICSPRANRKKFDDQFFQLSPQ